MRITQQQKEAVRARLVETGLTLFASQGFSGTKVDQITTAAGLAKGTFYNYFATKEDLALAALTAILAQIEQDLPSLLAGPRPLRDQLRTLFQRFAQWTSANPELVWVWCSEDLRRGPTEPSSLHFHRMLVALFAAGQQAGQVRADCDPQDLAQDLGGITLAAIARWYHSGAQSSLLADLWRGVDAYLLGIQPRTVPDKR